MWVDPNLSDFYERVARIQKAHADGYGFEAPGTVAKRTARRSITAGLLKLSKPLLFMLVLGIALKGTIHYFVGESTYEARLSSLATGSGIDPIGAWLMHPDPLSLFVSSQLQANWPR